MADKYQIQLDSCDATTGWTELRDAIAVTLDTTHEQEGTGCLNLGVDVSASADNWAEYYKVYSATDLSRANKFRFYLYIDATADLAKFRDIEIDFVSDAGYTKYFNMKIYPDELVAGWNIITKSMSQMQRLGTSPSWATIQKVTIDIYGLEDIALGNIKIDDLRFVEDIDEKYDVQINGIGYLLKEGSYNRNDNPFAQSQFSTGRFDISDWNIWQYHPHTNWSSGFNQKNEVDENKFYDSSYADVSDFGEIKMANERETVKAQMVAATEVTAIQSYKSKLYMGVQKPGSSVSYVYVWTGSGDPASSTTLTGKAYVTDMEVYNGKLHVATGMGSVVYNFDNSTWVDTNVKAVHYLKSWGGYLWGGYKENLYKWDGSTWATEYTIKQENIMRMEVYKGKLYYLATNAEMLETGPTNCSNCCLMSYDGNIRTRIYEFPENCRPDMITWNGKLWFIVGEILYSYNGSTITKELDIRDRWSPYGIGQYYVNRQDHGTSMMVSKGKMYVVYNPSSTTSGLLCNGGDGFFPILPAHTKRYTSLGTFDQGTTSEDHLFMGDTDGGLFKFDYKAYDTSVTAILESSWIDMELPGIDKIFDALIIKFEPLADDAVIRCYYKKDDDASWTFVSGAANEDAHIIDAGLPTGTYGKKIKYKIELETTSATATAVINDVMIRYLPAPDVKRKWTMGILLIDNQILRDETRHELKGNDLADELWTARQLKQTIAFKDIDDSNHNVIINDMQVKGPFLQGDRENPEYICYIEIVER